MTEIVKDPAYPGMYKIRLDDGYLSMDSYSLTRAKENVKKLQEKSIKVHMPRNRPEKATGKICTLLATTLAAPSEKLTSELPRGSGRPSR